MLLPLVMAAFRNGEKASVFRLFGSVYVVFLLCKLTELFFFVAWNQDGRRRTVSVPMLVFAATFLVYGGLVPWMALASSPLGDEAHFMILTHSLVFDHDFDVGDNYKHHDYKEDFPPPPPGEVHGYSYASVQRDGFNAIEPDPHDIKNFRGQLLLEHDMGFPLLLIPGYALFTLALVGALGAAAIYEAALLVGADSLRALLVVGLFCFTTPYWVFTQSVLSDLVGAVCSLWIGLQFLRYRVAACNRYLLLAGILISMLPWLNIRFWALAGPSFLVFTACIVVHSAVSRKVMVSRMAYLGMPNIVSLGAAAIIDKHLFNSYMPNASMLILGKIAPQFGMNPIHGFLGMLFDQSFGLIPTAPLYVAVVAGMIVLFRRDRWAFFALLLPAAGYLPFVSSSRVWAGGWCAPGRYMLPAVILMVPAAGLALNRKVRWLVAIFAGWSVAISIMFTVNPFLRMPSIWVFIAEACWSSFFTTTFTRPCTAS